jgi:hypothetical protein
MYRRIGHALTLLFRLIFWQLENKKPDTLLLKQSHRESGLYCLTSATQLSRYAGPAAFRPPITRSLALSVYVFLLKLIGMQIFAYTQKLKRYAHSAKRLAKFYVQLRPNYYIGNFFGWL